MAANQNSLDDFSGNIIRKKGDFLYNLIEGDRHVRMVIHQFWNIKGGKSSSHPNFQCC